MNKLHFTAKLISENRFTIPKAIRDALGIEIGDTVELQVSKVDIKGNGKNRGTTDE